jgi:hypothetical protein
MILPCDYTGLHSYRTLADETSGVPSVGLCCNAGTGVGMVDSRMMA